MNRIHWLSPGDPDQRTGGYLYNARIASALRGQGIDVVMHALNGPWPWPNVSHRQQLNKVPNDAVVIADGLLWPGLQAEERQELCGRCKVWVVMHSLFDKEDVGNDAAMNAELSALREAHGWFATSQRTARLLNERLGGPPGSIVIPGTDSSPRASETRGGPARLLNVAHLIPRKNQLVLMEALSDLTDLDWILDVVGSTQRDAEYSLAVKERVHQLGLTERVVFHGEQPPERIDELYGAARALVHTADFEAYGMVLTEALCRGVPVISTPAGALDDLDTAMVRRIGVGDTKGLSEAVRSLLVSDSIEHIEPPRFPNWMDQAALLTRVLGLQEEGFSVDWLRMREPYDHRARSISLAQQMAAVLGTETGTVMEMACGLGSGTRFLSAVLPGVQWLLVDHDPQLLDAVDKDMAETPIRYRTHQHDLRQLDGLDLSIRGVTTQALLDLVSHDWLVQFADWLADKQVPLLAALSVDGRVDWTPSDPRDVEVQHAFRTHQTWDRGFGPSPGPEAASVLKELLEARGFSVHLERTDWQIPASDEDMMSSMVQGISSAALEAAKDAGVDPKRVTEWRAERMNAIGQVSLRVGHLDLLAIP